MLVSVVGCGTSKTTKSDRLQVVTTFYPLYALTKAIGGNHVHVTSLIATGVEPHEWSPKAKDMMRISDADVFVYNGAGFEGWVDAFIQNESDAKLHVIEASEDVDLIQTGKQAVDPHIWTSPVQALKMANTIYKGLVKADEKHQADYAKNLAEVEGRLHKINKVYSQAVAQASSRDIVVSHEAFQYLARDYGLRAKSIMGLSPEAEPTAKQLKKITTFVKANHVKVILVEALASPKLAETLAHDLGVQTVPFNPLEGLTKKQQQAGEDYFSLLTKNAHTLQKALQ
jgi:zinc transport system substrate-binding protein